MIEVTYLVDSFRAFHRQDDEAELEVPENWRVAWEQGGAPGVHHRPECRADNELIRTGPYSANLRTRHATHDAAYYLKGSVDPGAMLMLSAYVRQLDERAGHAMRIGIDPTGGEDFTAPTVVWSGWRGHYDHDGGAFQVWEMLSVGTPAKGPTATIFLASKTEWAMSNVSAWFDDVRFSGLVEEGGAGNEELIGQLVAAVSGIREGLGVMCAALEALEGHLSG